MTNECCAADLRDALFDLREWLLWKLDTAAAHVPGQHSPSGHPRGWCAIQIPDWDVKQKVESINQLLGPKPERNGANR